MNMSHNFQITTLECLTLVDNFQATVLPMKYTSQIQIH